MFASLAGKLLIAFLLQRVSSTLTVYGAPAGQSSDVCSPESVESLFNDAELHDQDENELAEKLYEQCNNEFLEKNLISSEVKDTIDSWIGKDLSKEDSTQLLLTYEMNAMLSPKPENTSDKFKEECKHMIGQYESYRDTSAIIAEHIQTDSDLMTSEMTEINPTQRELLNFAIYSQLCNLVLQ